MEIRKALRKEKVPSVEERLGGIKQSSEIQKSKLEMLILTCLNAINF